MPALAHPAESSSTQADIVLSEVEHPPISDLAISEQVAQLHIRQSHWQQLSVRERTQLLKQSRHRVAAHAEPLAAHISQSLPRSLADSLAAEVLPLLDAWKFLEKEASRILAPQRLSNHRRPWWLAGVSVEVLREPFGVVLIIGPGNYPLFLAGVQVLQALAAGNAVLLKPGHGGHAVAQYFIELLQQGRPAHSAPPVAVLDESTESATAAIHARVDKVFLTGSASTGKAVLSQLAHTLTPSVMELSGCDAVFVLENADLDRVAQALAFGLRFNGSQTCMAPRRVFVTGTAAKALELRLRVLFNSVPPIQLPAKTIDLLRELITDARAHGAIVQDDVNATALAPILVTYASPAMRITQTDIFAPVLSLIIVKDMNEALLANTICPYALTAAIFGPLKAAEAFARRIPAGAVVINDLIAPTADPRVSFGGRRQSGFGSTRGREGLLEMTAVKTIITRTGRSTRHHEPTGPLHAEMFAGAIAASHASGWRRRWAGARRAVKAAMQLDRK